jgi:hypothetical protein
VLNICNVITVDHMLSRCQVPLGRDILVSGRVNVGMRKGSGVFREAQKVDRRVGIPGRMGTFIQLSTSVSTEMYPATLAIFNLELSRIV